MSHNFIVILISKFLNNVKVSDLHQYAPIFLPHLKLKQHTKTTKREYAVIHELKLLEFPQACISSQGKN